MNISGWDIIFTLINFFLLLFILYKFLWKTLLNAMDSRKKEIDDNLEKAEQARQEVAETQTQIAADMETARRQAREIVEEAQHAGEEAKNAILGQADEAAAAILARAEEEIEQQKISAIAEIKAEMGGLIITLTQKLLAENLTPKQQQSLVDKYIKELEALK